MVKIIKKRLILMCILIISMFMVGCNQNPKINENNKLNVIVSIIPQKTFLKEIGGKLINVNELIPPGGSPSTYDPKPSEIGLIEKSDIYFRIGHIPFEANYIDNFKKLNPNLAIIDTSKNVELRYFNGHETHKHEEEIHHENKDVDPHIWLSPIQVKKQVDTITKSLSEIDPNNSQIYYNNSKEFKEKLDLLDSKIRSIFNETKTKKIMVFHPAWGYFTDEYGLEQIIIEESGKEPTAKKLQQIINHGKEENIKFIFVQSQFNKDVAESIAEEIDAVTISIDPLSENYIENLEKIAIKIKESLN